MSIQRSRVPPPRSLARPRKDSSGRPRPPTGLCGVSVAPPQSPTREAGCTGAVASHEHRTRRTADASQTRVQVLSVLVNKAGDPDVRAPLYIVAMIRDSFEQQVVEAAAVDVRLARVEFDGAGQWLTAPRHGPAEPLAAEVWVRSTEPTIPASGPTTDPHRFPATWPPPHRRGEPPDHQGRSALFQTVEPA